MRAVQQIGMQVPGGKIVRSQDPLNLEMPFEKLDGFINPDEIVLRPDSFPDPEDRQKQVAIAWGMRTCSTGGGYT
jgi:hypothetical protein